jgi:hypothetical protein
VSAEQENLVASPALDALDQKLLQTPVLDGRAPFSRIARVLGVPSSRTVARRFGRPRTTAGLRETGMTDGGRPGRDGWIVRLGFQHRSDLIGGCLDETGSTMSRMTAGDIASSASVITYSCFCWSKKLRLPWQRRQCEAISTGGRHGFLAQGFRRRCGRRRPRFVVCSTGGTHRQTSV